MPWCAVTLVPAIRNFFGKTEVFLTPVTGITVCVPSMETTPLAARSVIVAADDDEDDVELMRMLFRKAGVSHPFEVFANGEDVIAALKNAMMSAIALPLLCFLDVKMPALTGHDVLHWIRQHRELDQIPVVMLTSSEHPADVEQAIRNGAQCYLAKYPHPSVLQQVIAEAERFANGVSASDCFRIAANLLLRP